MPSLVILAAGLSTRYGGGKQLAPVGPSGEALLDYALYDAIGAGFRRAVLVIRRDAEAAFRQHVERLGGGVEVALAYQEPAADRTAPWGTGHAVLAAEPLLGGEPFAVANADDYYGALVYHRLHEHLRAPQPPNLPLHALIVYRLIDTPLSGSGGVSRGVCEVDEDGYLQSIVEVRQIRRANGGYVGTAVDGRRFVLQGDEPVSMNLWGFSRAIFPALRRQFELFVAGRPAPDDEFLLSTAVNQQIESGVARVRAIPAGGPGLGITYREDRETASQAIAALVAEGRYPADLYGWFRRRR